MSHNLKRPITFSLLAIYFVFAWRVEGDNFLHRDEQFRKLSLVQEEKTARVKFVSLGTS